MSYVHIFYKQFCNRAGFIAYMVGDKRIGEGVFDGKIIHKDVAVFLQIGQIFDIIEQKILLKFILNFITMYNVR